MQPLPKKKLHGESPHSFSSLQVPEHPLRIKTRTSLRDTSRHIPVPPDPDTGKDFHHPHQQQNKLLRLFRCPGIGRMPVRIQAALITDTYAATVPRAAVRPHFQQLAVLRHTSVAADIKMIPHRAETACLVVAEQLLGGVIPGAARGAAMNHDIFHGSGGGHHRAVLQCEEGTLVRDLFLTDYHRESFLNHTANGGFLKKGAATGYAQGGECRYGGLDNGAQNLLPGDFIGMVHKNICFKGFVFSVIPDKGEESVALKKRAMASGFLTLFRMTGSF